MKMNLKMNYVITVEIATANLQTTWKNLNPPVKEEQILGKWYAVIYETKCSNMLFVVKPLRRFLGDENGPTESLEMKCLKPMVGSGTTLEDTPEHLPDISVFYLSKVIAGPLEVLPLKGSTKFDVPEYENLVEHCKVVVKLNRKSMLI